MKKAPKSMKDPVRIAGKWEERVPQPLSFGHSKVDIKKLYTEIAIS